jgi:hypothetical protein
MGIIEFGWSGQVEECDDCGVGIPPETEYAIWGDLESGLELLLYLKCAERRKQRKQQHDPREGQA